MKKTNDKNNFFVKSYRKEKIKTTYRYLPIIGDILGFWREVNQKKIGTEIILHVKTPLENYDRIYINNIEIPIEEVLVNGDN